MEIVTVATAIAGAIATVAVTVASVIAAILAAIASVLIYVVGMTYAAIATAVTAIVDAFIYIGVWMGQHLAWFAGRMVYHLTLVWYDIQYWAYSLYYDFMHILEVIHFKVILEINQIAMLLIPQYREIMQKVYQAVGEVSNAFYKDATFMVNVLRNTRNLVLDVASSLGYKYDLAEVTWIATMSSILQRVQSQAYKYRGNPEALFYDIAEMVERGAIDMKAGVTAGIFTTIEGILKQATGVAENIDKISKDLFQLVWDLPESVRKYAAPIILPVTQRIDVFIRDEFNPARLHATTMINALIGDKDRIQADLTEAIKRILTPEQTVAGLTVLTPEKQAEVSETLNTLSNIKLSQLVLQISQSFKPLITEFEKILTMPLPTVPPPPFLMLEPAMIQAGESPSPSTKAGWFVGDF